MFSLGGPWWSTGTLQKTTWSWTIQIRRGWVRLRSFKIFQAAGTYNEKHPTPISGFCSFQSFPMPKTSKNQMKHHEAPSWGKIPRHFNVLYDMVILAYRCCHADQRGVLQVGESAAARGFRTCFGEAGCAAVIPTWIVPMMGLSWDIYGYIYICV